jgi:hypothetical protein
VWYAEQPQDLEGSVQFRRSEVNRYGVANASRARWLAGLTLAVALPLLPAAARADSSSVVYEGHDLGLPLKDALAQIQATGSSRGDHINLSITGSGDLLMFTEVNGDAIETETASYKDLEFDRVEVRKIGQVDGRYGITLRAADGAVNDHIVGVGGARTSAPDRDNALGYMDFWLVDPDMSRVRRLADLFATMHARLKDTGQTETAQAAPLMIAPSHAVALASAGTAVRAAEIAAATHADAPDDADTAGDTDARTVSAAKCLLQPPKKSRRAHVHQAAFSWGAVKAGATSGNGRLSYRIAPLHGPDDHQQIAFSFTNMLPVPATLVARVIVTSASGEQQAENLSLTNVAARASKSDESLTLAPFDDNACITDVEVTVLRACPLPDESQAADDAQNVFNCNADAASGTTTVGGITYIAGREPKNLAVPHTLAPIRTSATQPIAEAGN